MATADVSNGTGGLDGSIVYELDRAAVCNCFLCLGAPSHLSQNFGAGFTDTVSDFQAYPNKYVSRAV